MGEPPSLAGAVHETAADALPAVAWTEVGAPGMVGAGFGVTALDGLDACPVPIPLAALEVNV